jgi:hypothetical protein
MLWIRVGDRDDYRPMDSLADIAEDLRESGIKEVWRYCYFGLGADGYVWHNYISAYHGSSPDDPESELSDEEIKTLNQLLSEDS